MNVPNIASALASIEKTRLLERELGWQKLNQAISNLTEMIEEKKKNQLAQELTKFARDNQEVPPEAATELANRYKMPVAEVLKMVEPVNKMVKTRKYQLAGKMLLDIISKKKRLDPADLLVVEKTTDVDPKTFTAMIKTAGDIIDRYQLHHIIPDEIRQVFEKRVAPLPEDATWEQASMLKQLVGTKPEVKTPKKRVWYNRKTGESMVSPVSPGEGWVTEAVYTKLVSKTKSKSKDDGSLFSEKELFSKFSSIARDVAKDLPFEVPNIDKLSEDERRRIIIEKAKQRYKEVYPTLPLPKAVQETGPQQPSPGDALGWIQNWMQRRQQPQSSATTAGAGWSY